MLRQSGGRSIRMSRRSAQISMVFSCLGHAYMHAFTASYFVIVLALEVDWQLPYHELIELWTFGALLVGVAALPAGWIADRWSASGMMVVFFVGMGLAAIVCGLVDSSLALFIGLTSIGLFASIYHPVGIAWLVRNATSRGKALGINGIFGSVGVAAAGAAAGALIDLAGWRAAFIVPGVVSLVTGLCLAYFISRGMVVEGDGDRAQDAPPSRADMVRVFAILAVTMLVMGLIFHSTQTALPKVFDLRLRDVVGEGAFGVGAIIAFVYVVGGIMQVIGGYLADRMALKRLYVGAYVLQIPALVLVAQLAGTPLIAVAVLTVLLSVVALPAENMLLARYTPQRHRSLAYGVKFVLAFSIAPVALQIVSFVQERTGEFVWLFLILAGTASVAFVLSLFLPNDRKPVLQTVPAE